MYTDDEIDEIGFALEEGGLSHSEIDDYFEHVGVKGMKWGVRRAAKKAAKSEGRSSSDRNRKVAKGALIAAGLLAATGGAAYATSFHKTGYTKDGKKLVKAILENDRMGTFIAGPKGTIRTPVNPAKFKMNQENIKRLTGL